MVFLNTNKHCQCLATVHLIKEVIVFLDCVFLQSVYWFAIYKTVIFNVRAV